MHRRLRNTFAAFVAALMREGTVSRTSEQISQHLEVMAATLTVAAGASSIESTVAGSSLSDQFDRLLDVTADVLIRPSFPEEELARYKQRTRAQLTQQRASPNFLAAETYNRVVYGAQAAKFLQTLATLLERPVALVAA